MGSFSKIIYAVVIVLVIGILFTNISALLFKLPLIQNEVINYVESIVNKKIIGVMQIRSIKSNFVNKITIDEIVFSDSVNRIVIKNIAVWFLPWSLINKRIAIKRVEAGFCNVSINTDNKGHYTFPLIPRTKNEINKTESREWVLNADSIFVDNVFFSLNDNRKYICVKIEGASAFVRINSLDSIHFMVNGIKGKTLTRWYSDHHKNGSINGAYTKEKLHFTSAHFTGEHSSIDVKGTVPVNLDSLLYAQVAVCIASKALPFLDQSQIIKMQGNGVFNGKVLGTFRRPLIDAEIKIKEIKRGDLNIDSIVCQNEYKDDKLKSQIRIFSSEYHGTISVDAVINRLLFKPQIERYTLSGNVISPEPGGFFLIGDYKLQFPQIAAELKFSLNGNGLEFPYASTLQIAGKSTKLKRKPQLLLSTRNNLWQLTGNFVNNRINGSGQISDYLDIDGFVDIEFDSLNEFMITYRESLVKGDISGKISFFGNIRDLSVNATLNSDSISISKLTMYNTDIRFKYKKKLIIQSFISHVKGNPDDIIRDYYSSGIGGDIDAEIQINGEYPQLSAKILFECTEFYFKNIRSDTIKGTISFAGIENITWNTVKIIQNGVVFTTEGTANIGRYSSVRTRIVSRLKNRDKSQGRKSEVAANVHIHDGRITGKLKTLGFDLQTIQSLYPFPMKISGYLSSDSYLSGTTENPEIQSSFKLDSFSTDYLTIHESSGTLELNNLLLQFKSINKTPSIGSGFILDAYIPLHKDPGWRIDMSGKRERKVIIQTDNVSLDELNLFIRNDMYINGLFSANVNFSGYDKEWLISGVSSIRNGELSSESREFRLQKINANVEMGGNAVAPEITVKAIIQNGFYKSIDLGNISAFMKFANRTIAVDSLLLKTKDNGRLLISTVLRFPKNNKKGLPVIEKLDYSIKNIPIKIIEPFVATFEIKSGWINGKGQYTKGENKNKSSGSILLSDIVLSSTIIEQQIGPVCAELSLDEQSVTVKSFKGRIGDKPFFIRGDWSAFSESQRLNISLTGKMIQITLPDLVKVQMEDIAIQFEFQWNKPFRITGIVSLGPTYFIRDLRLDDIIQLLQGNQEISARNRSSGNNISINLQLQKNLFIDMNLANCQLDGSILLSGTLESPKLLGEVRIIEGYVYYFDRQFKVTDSKLVSVNRNEFNPSIMLSAYTEIQVTVNSVVKTEDYTIYLNVRGTLNEPVITLTSKPSLSETDILSILTLGTTINNVGRGVASRIGNLIGNEILGFGTHKLERFLNLESIKIQGNLFGKNARAPEITIVKRVSDRLTVSYGKGISAIRSQKISILFRLLSYLFLTGQTDDLGSFEVKLKFRYSR
jgi:hypothetical protein